MACDEPVLKFIDAIRTQVIFVGEIHGFAVEESDFLQSKKFIKIFLIF
jgi:hypothetical protein